MDKGNKTEKVKDKRTDKDEMEKPKKSHKRASEDSKEPGSSKEAKTTPAEPHASINAELVALFKELASFEFKQQETYKGIAYNKVAKTLSEMDPDISPLQVKDVSGIGKASIRKINEFMKTGKIETLEKYRRRNFDDPD